MTTINKSGHTYNMFRVGGIPGRNSLFDMLSYKLGKSHLLEPVFFKKTNIIMDDKDGTKHHFTSLESLIKMLYMRR
jgi:hypothetical protein